MNSAVPTTRAALDAVVEWVLEEANVNRPPVDAMTVAEKLGLEVRLDKEQDARGRLLCRRQPTICVRPEPRLERYHWTVAHEIGESLMPRILQELGREGDSCDAELREELANRFAGLLLVPSHWLEFDSRMTGFDLLELKKLYRTASFEVIALRMLDLDPPTIVTIFDNGRLTRRRWNQPHQIPRLSALEREVRERCHEDAEPVSHARDGISVQAWPVHEEGWRREILRTVVDVEGEGVWD